jgi:hypothetical protein
MPQDLLRGAFDTLRSRLQAELDGQLAELEERQAAAILEARRAAEQEAEGRWTARLDETRGEWAARLESERAAAAADADRRLAAEAERHRAALEQAVAEARESARQEWERTLESERDRARRAADHARQELETITSELAQTRTELARLQQDLQRVVAEGQHSAETLERERAGFASERQRLQESGEQAISALRAEHDRVQAELAQERERAGQLDAARTEAAALHAEATTALTAAGADLDALRGALEQERARGRELEAARAAALAAQGDAARSLDAVQAEIDGARKDGQAAVEAERERVRALTATLEEAQAALARTRDESRQAAEMAAERARATEQEIESRVAERQWRLAVVERLLGAVKAIGAARSLSDTLAALVAGAAAEAPRAALFIVSGARLQGWRAHGFGAASAAAFQAAAGDGSVIGEAARTGEPVSTTAASAPAFAALAAGRAGIAVPVTVGGQAVAVLYVDDGAGGEPEAPASWPEAIQLLGRHASACLAHLTAVRTAQAMRAAPAAVAPVPAGARPADDDTSARRYARLLVSEIKLYNEGAVRVGREKRDLLRRLRSEIDRARRLYEERVPDATGPRSAYFQQELVQILADGDASLLGEAV